MAILGRRKFIITGGAATLGLSLATLVTNKQARAIAPGELIPDPDGILDLPEGFSYKILEEKGDAMDDGYQVPGRPDGMACFTGPGNTLILMRNHENTPGDSGNSPYKNGQDADPNAYDPDGMGGVSRLVIDAHTFERISSNLVLIGTVRNCCGGPSPWGWLSCEEDTSINGNYRHGYVFACPADAESVQAPNHIAGYGRFNHEAVAVDPSNYHAYLTEDRGDACVYRFVPDDMSDPFVGKLQALKVVGQDQYKTTNMAEGEVVDIEWVDIDEPDPDSDTVREQGHAAGAAVFVRGEGAWFFQGQVYVCSTAGGEISKGQIFRVIDGDSPTLELVVQSMDAGEMQKPDNITVAPWGEIFAAEDGDDTNHIRWITAEGQILPFARNAGSASEFAGVCFSPKGDALFVNMQNTGRTLVITGPFPESQPPPGEGESTGEGDSTDGETDGGDSTDGGGEGGTTTASGEDDGNGEGTGGATEGEGGADEVGDDGDDNPWTWPRESVEDCNCTTTGENSGAGAAATGLATLVLGKLLRDRE